MNYIFYFLFDKKLYICAQILMFFLYNEKSNFISFVFNDNSDGSSAIVCRA